MMWALFLFFLSGILGLVLLANAWVPDLARPLVPQLALIPGLVILFPLFTGLFGLPTLILSLLDKAEVRPQCMDGKVTLPRGRGLRGVITGTLSGTFVGWYPGVTGAQASVIAASMSSLVDRLNGQWKGKGKMFRAPEASGHDTKEFLVSMAAVGTANAIFNMVAMFTIFKARSGALKGVMTVMGPGLVAWSPISSPPVTLLLFLFAVLISGVISYLAMLLIGRFMARNYSRVPYTKLAAGIIIMILVMLFVVAGPLGLAITGISLCLGLLPPLVGVRRVHLMGCIMLPVICFQLGLAG